MYLPGRKVRAERMENSFQDTGVERNSLGQVWPQGFVQSYHDPDVWRWGVFPLTSSTVCHTLSQHYLWGCRAIGDLKAQNHWQWSVAQWCASCLSCLVRSQRHSDICCNKPAPDTSEICKWPLFFIKSRFYFFCQSPLKAADLYPAITTCTSFAGPWLYYIFHIKLIAASFL